MADWTNSKDVYIVIAEIETDKTLEERTISVRKSHISSHRVPSTIFENNNAAIIQAIPSESDSNSFSYLEGLYDEGNKKVRGNRASPPWIIGKQYKRNNKTIKKHKYH